MRARSHARARFAALLSALGLTCTACSALFPFEQFDALDGGSGVDAAVEVPDGGDAGPEVDGGACPGADTLRDPDHCGACGTICATDQLCAAGQCRGLVDVVGGDTHTCMLTDDGAVFCWGMNRSLELGAPGQDRGEARNIGLDATLGVAVQLASGDNHVCARTDSGEVLCWGRNNFGNAGNASASPTTGPVQVVGLNGEASDLACGSQHCCAVVSGGTRVKCWGGNEGGPLGDNSETNRESPVTVQADGPVDLMGEMLSVFAGGSQSCALDGVTGELHCWGDSSNGQLTLASPRVLIATPITLPTGEIVDFAMGRNHTCAILQNGSDRELYCWGRGVDGQLGTNSLVGTPTPGRVGQFGVISAANDIADVVARGDRACVNRTGPPASTWCWGSNDNGEVGSPDLGVVGLPHEVPLAVTNLGAGRYVTCGLRERQLHCWGADSRGAVGIGAELIVPTPRAVSDVSDAVSVIAGTEHTCVVRGAGLALDCFGTGDTFRRGDATESDSSAPTSTGLVSVTDVDTESAHTCAIGQLPAGATGVYCFGQASAGQTGQGTTPVSTPTPTLVPLDSANSFVDVFTGTDHSCAVATQNAGADVGYQCWGYNGNGELGVGGTMVGVPGPRSFRTFPIAGAVTFGGAGASYSLVVLGDNVVGWGFQNLGRLANNQTDARGNPLTFALPGITSFDVGPFGTCAAVGTDLVCWGHNSHGQLGQGAPGRLTSPTPEVAPLTVEGVAIGWTHACVRGGAGGEVHCRGANDYGQIGDGTTDDGGATFRRAAMIEDAVSVAAGEEHTCAVDAGGAVYCWGHDAFGRLGSGRRLQVETPTPIVYAAP